MRWSRVIRGEALRDAFGEAAPQQFAWQTEARFVSDRERALVQAAFLPLGRRVLDLGCAEGATLHHLGAPANAVGLDLFPPKLAFARAHVSRSQFVAGSACELPFARGSFDHVLVRDLIHHLPEPARVIDECARVLSSGGRIDVLEPCRYNPLIVMHALSQPAERGELRSSARFLTTLLGSRFEVDQVRHHQALPLHRILFHHKMGWPTLADFGPASALLDGFERLADAVVPAWARMYIHARGTLRSAD